MNTPEYKWTYQRWLTASLLAKATRDSFLPFNQALNRLRNMTGLRNEGGLWQKPWVHFAAMSTNSRPSSIALLEFGSIQ